MKRIAFVGATSQIAKDLVLSFVEHGVAKPLLYVRHVDTAAQWLQANSLQEICSLHRYDEYGQLPHEAVINFVGVGDPKRAAEMGSSIFEVTQRFDDMVLVELVKNPLRRYLFLSSGAAYGNSFTEPVTADTEARIAINAIAPQDYYAVAKLHAEVRHRSRPNLSIVDIRVFNYFSRTQDVEARFFITDIVRAVRDGKVLRTSPDYIVRDFLHPQDFFQLVRCLLDAPPHNGPIDCYSSAAVDKPALLKAMHEHFGLNYEIAESGGAVAINATGAKPHYYSLNRQAAAFGYQPQYSSLGGVLEETRAILSRQAPQVKTIEKL
jgi:nucleoside-diphosphate-sugar epimerase